MDFSLALWVLLLVTPSLQVSNAREVSTVVNPGCESKCEQEYDAGWPNLVYTKSEGEEDTVHHLWSTVGDKPSLLLLQTTNSSWLKFTWTRNEHYIIPTISLSGKLLYAFALVFNKLWEYRDVKDEGSMSDSMDNVTFIDFGSFSWQNVSDTLTTSEKHTTVLFQTKTNSSGIFGEKGLLSLQLETQGQDGRNDIIPRLLYTSNSSQVRLILDSILPHFEESRFAVEISLFLTELTSPDIDSFKSESVKSMDDEYTPGVFKSMRLLSGNSQRNLSGSYVAWKPVAYTTDDLSVTGSTSTVYYSYVKHTESNSSVAENFFMHNSVPVEGIAFNMSFGNSKDGFYNATHYTQWTFSYGLGVPGEDRLSSLVIAVIASGLGLPMLLIVLSSVYLGWHKYNMKKDDLSLSRR